MLGNNQNNSFLSYTSLIFVARFFSNLATFAVMYEFAHHLSIDKYGQYQNIWAQLNFFTVVASIGIPLFTLSYSTEKVIALFKKISTKQYGIYFAFLTLCGIVFALIQRDSISQWYLVILFLIVFTISNIADAFLIVYRRLGTLAIISIAYSVFYFCIHFYYLKYNDDISELFVLWIALLSVKLLVCYFVLRHSGKNIVLDNSNNTSSFKSIKQLWRHIYYSSLIQVSFLWIDKFIISIFMNDKQSAMYFNGTINIPFLPIIISAITNSTLLFLSNNNDKKVQHEIIKNTGCLLANIAFPLCLYFLFFSKDIITFVFSEKYIECVPIFICSILVLPVRAFDFTSVLQKNEKGQILIKGALFDLIIAITLMYPLYWIMGLAGVALSFTLSTIFQAAYYSYFTSKILNIRVIQIFPLRNWFCKIILFGALSYLLFLLLPETVIFIPKFLCAGIVIALAAIIIFFWEFKKSDIRTAKQLI